MSALLWMASESVCLSVHEPVTLASPVLSTAPYSSPSPISLLQVLVTGTVVWELGFSLRSSCNQVPGVGLGEAWGAPGSGAVQT